MSKKFGKCALCGKECELTFEHIPPKAAFNSAPAKPVTGAGMLQSHRMPWDTSGLRYNNQQQGMGKFSICADCNNKTGAWYCSDYIKIAQIMHGFFFEGIPENVNTVVIKEIYPLRFIKQIISMFCSINNLEDTSIQELREFVLDKTSSGLDRSKFRISMYFTKSHYAKYAPWSVLTIMKNNTIENFCISEITAYPFGFILYFNPPKDFKCEGFDITDCADSGYDEMKNIEFPLCIKEMNDFFPLQYRSKEEILQCLEKNKRRGKNNEC